MKTCPTLEEIEALVKLGLHDQAFSYLEKGRLLKIWSMREVIWAADLYSRIGQVALAIKILPDEVKKNDLKMLNKVELILQIRLAEILSFIGAKYVAIRIYDKVSYELKSRNMTLEDEYPVFKFHLAHLCLSWGDFDSALSNYEMSATNLTLDPYKKKLSILGKTDCFAAFGLYDKAIEELMELKKTITDNEQVLMGMIDQAIGEYYFKSERYDKAEDFFKLSLKTFGENVKTKDFAYLAKWYGALRLKQDKRTEASQFLKQSFEILNQHLGEPMALIDVLYWMELLNSSDIDLGLKIMSRCHYTRPPTSYLFGKQLEIHERYKVPDWYQRYAKNSHKEDCWVITKGSIDAQSYEDLSLNEQTLDLTAGCFIKEDKKVILTVLQKNCLIAIVSTGSAGIHEFALVDYVYREELFYLESGKDRIKELTKTLKNFGHYISKNKSYYQLDLRFEGTIILPMNLVSLDPLVLLKKFHPSFSRQDVENFFGIGRTLAKELIYNWLKSGKVSKFGQSTKTYYQA